MKQWLWVSCLAICLVSALFLWFDQSAGRGELPLSPADTLEKIMAPKDDSARAFDDAAPLPLNEILPELERLAAPVAPGAGEQTIEQLQQEAEQLIEQTDRLLASESLAVPVLSGAERADIQKRPAFRATLEREASLEERLESLP